MQGDLRFSHCIKLNFGYGIQSGLGCCSDRGYLKEVAYIVTLCLGL